MEPLLVYPNPPPGDLTELLTASGYPWRGVSTRTELEELEPRDGWAGAVICATREAQEIAAHPEGLSADDICQIVRNRDIPLEPLLLLIPPTKLTGLSIREDLFDDFCVWPAPPGEFEARMRRLFVRTTGGSRPELLEYEDLVLNTETYQAAIHGQPLDLTFMEYELLKFLAQEPGKVFSRETLLSRVWGYDYYGGARTVDVHIRRLRAKLGEEHANLIQTVRSVGYRFGQSKWGF